MNSFALSCPRFGGGQKNGFTLGELMVVISIIAILSSIVLPTIGLVRFSSLGVQCANNKRQSAAGILAYAGDWKAQLPWTSGFPAYYVYQGKQINSQGHSCTVSWLGQIFPYTGTMAIARCKAESGNPTSGGAGDPNWGLCSTKLATPGLCPSPLTCSGRSDMYTPWTSGVMSTHATPLQPSITNVFLTTPCSIFQFKNKMTNAIYNVGGLSNVSRYTGMDQSGLRPDTAWTWSNVFGSTLVCDMWAGAHRIGTKRGAAMASIDGSARFRTYRDITYKTIPILQATRYDEP